MKSRKIFSTLLGAVLLSGAVTIAQPGTASAAFNCSHWREWPNRAYATCTLGLGGQRVVYECWNPVNGNRDTFWGPWVSVGQVSTGICNGGRYATWSGVETFS